MAGRGHRQGLGGERDNALFIPNPPHGPGHHRLRTLARHPVYVAILMLLSTFVGALASAADPFPAANVECGFTSTALGWDGTLLLETVPPTGHYLILESSQDPGGPFTAIDLHLLSGSSTVRHVFKVERDRNHAFFRLRAVSDEHPGDVDVDGMDDVYEVLRRPVLNPLDASDADDDANGDGVNNLAEYLAARESGTEEPLSSVHYRTLVDLRRVPTPPLPGLLYLEGYERTNDGWGGWFLWKPNALSPADDALVAELIPGRPGRLERSPLPGEASAAWWRPSNDGSANAGPALQRALDFLATRKLRRLVIPPGRYRLEARIAMIEPGPPALFARALQDFEIDGTGATLFSESDGELLIMSHCRRGSVRGLTLEGSGSDRGQSNCNYAAVHLTGSGSDLLFERCRVTRFMHGISHLDGEKTTVRVTIRGCSFEDGGDTRHRSLGVDGAAISGVGDDWLIEDNDIRDCARGIEVENTSKRKPISRVIIRGNRITEVRSCGIMAFLGDVPDPTGQQDDIRVLNNVVVGRAARHRTAGGMALPIMNICINGGTRWAVEGNLCDIGDFAGISLHAIQAPLRDSRVCNNRISRMAGRGIQILSTSNYLAVNILVSGNEISTCGDRGLLITGHRVVVQGNRILDTGVAGVAVGDFLRPEIASSDIEIRNQVLMKIRAPAPAIALGASVSRVTVCENQITDVVLGIQCLARHVSIADNLFLRVTCPMDPEAVDSTLYP